MKTKLFNSIIFGPITSRRLGLSLGINLLPTDSKLCNFDCIYCECGWTDLKSAPKVEFHKRADVKNQLETILKQLQSEEKKLNSITFAGNGEPTLHPDFNLIIDDVIKLRDHYFPLCKISVLSNSLMLNNSKVTEALKKVDNRILKLDAGTEETFQLINQPLNKRTLKWVVEQLIKFNGDLTIQTLFLKGKYKNHTIDNTTDFEIESWLSNLKKIKPKLVMLYSLDRATPAKDLQKIDAATLNSIAKKVEAIGIEAIVS
ncbi:MAG: radical SAM protein [Bacteroidetes bacterium RIFCSPLOWO2_12_FULL_35_15]|nr:MAG: radical SAM protein [Bacteroidetes bacterium RIFCSPLOWO2_12_FULL_35_15]